MDHLAFVVREHHHTAREAPNGVYNAIKLCDEGDLSIHMSVETDLVSAKWSKR